MTVTIRERRPEDLPALVTLLAEQQPTSSYPVRWPLPFPVERFLVRPSERRAWVAEEDGVLLGHVAVGDPEELTARFAAGTGATAFGMVSVLFTALAARGRGAGGLLLDTAVAWIRARGEVPALDVVPTHDTALAIYRARGWAEVGHERFAWMSEHVPDVVLMALPPYPVAGPSTASSTSA